MPYISVDDVTHRYLGEHTCGRHHYGNMSMFRRCCVADCLCRLRRMLRYALTSADPNAVLFANTWDSLTTAEQKYILHRFPKQTAEGRKIVWIPTLTLYTKRSTK